MNKIEKLNVYLNEGILIATIPKSGTNMIKIFLANYLALLNCRDSKYIDYNTMSDNYFYSARELLLSGKEVKNKSDCLEQYGYKTLCHTHGILDATKLRQNNPYLAG
ncbi:hypothetical protein AB4256_17685 [Vibrio breoganii]